VTERETDNETIRTATYGTAAWRDVDAAGALYDAIAGDAAAVDADAARVLIPETVEHVSDTGANRIPVAAEPDFVMSAGPHGRTMSLFGVALPWSLPLTLVIYGVVVAAAVWIYRDAKARGSRYAIVWALATLLFTIVPVLAYLYLHHPRRGPARSERPDR